LKKAASWRPRREIVKTISALLIAIVMTSTPTFAAAAQRRGATHTAEVWRSYANHLPVGSTLAIRTTSGERLTAVLFVVDDTAVIVKAKTRLPEAARRISFDDIDDMSVRQNRVSIAKYVGIGAAVGAGVFLWFLSVATSD
jgi:hypothetical protein